MRKRRREVMINMGGWFSRERDEGRKVVGNIRGWSNEGGL